MRFWERAETAAAMEFGRRHYRGIIAWKLARAVAAPVIGAIAVGLVVLTVARYVWPALHRGAPVAWHWSANLLPGLVVAAICLLAVPAAVLAWRKWGWEMEARAPWLTGRLVSVLGSLVLVATATAVVWPR